MSSSAVRTAFKTFMSANAPTETLVDMSAAYQDIDVLLDENGLTKGDTWIAVNFLANDELPITIASGNDKGKYRENGIIQIHVVGLAMLGVRDSILARSETLRNLLRGRRIGNVVRVESVSPPNFEQGSTLEFEAGFMSATFTVEYEFDFDL